jgi:carbamoyl-phosphate synthase large subunit
MASYKVLVFPCQTAIAQEIKDALADRRDVELCCAHSDCSAPDCGEHYSLPHVGGDLLVNHLDGVVRVAGVTHILPAHDEVLYHLSRLREHVGAKVVSSPSKTTDICRFKSATYAALAGVVRTPQPATAFPAFAKPDEGQGGVGGRIVYADSHVREGDIVTELLTGPEYTVDCLSDRDKGLLFCGARERVRVRGGVAVKTRVTSDFVQYANAISSVLEFHGAWHFQMKEDAWGRKTLLEVACRVASASSLYRVSGVNFPYLSLLEADRVPFRMPLNRPPVYEAVKQYKTTYRHGLKFNTVYVDLDDTLFIKGKTNYRLIGALHKFRDEGKTLILITRSTQNPSDVLRSGFVSGELFHRIVWMSQASKKRKYMTEPDSILIDDSFAEREDAGIPALSCDMLELLA